jgi:hypothetical protein
MAAHGQESQSEDRPDDDQLRTGSNSDQPSSLVGLLGHVLSSWRYTLRLVLIVVVVAVAAVAAALITKLVAA